jgi:hypothetical protein
MLRCLEVGGFTQGHGAHNPAALARKLGKPLEPYLRLVAKTPAGYVGSAYINTSTVTITPKQMVEIVKILPRAGVRSSTRAVAFSVEDLDKCLSAAKAMLASRSSLCRGSRSSWPSSPGLGDPRRGAVHP